MTFRSAARLSILAILATLTGCGSTPKWDDHFEADLPRLGNDNWIIVADAAFPYHVDDGIRVLASDESMLGALDYVLDEIDDIEHVTPVALTASELERIPERDAPGITAYRRALLKRLGTISSQNAPEKTLLAQIKEALKTHRVLIVKSEGKLPYSAVYLKLGSAYWSSDREKRLRSAIENAQ